MKSSKRTDLVSFAHSLELIVTFIGYTIHYDVQSAAARTILVTSDIDHLPTAS